MKGMLLLGLLAVLLLPVSARAANVCVWNYDPLDQFYDPEAGDTIDCAYWLERELVELGHTVTVDTTLPSNLDGYDAVFCLMGWYRC